VERRDPGEAAEAAAIAATVEAGTDDIELPAAMCEEAAEGTEATMAVTIRQKPESSTLYAQLLTMGLNEKIKLALRGNKEARVLLARDASKTIRRYVLQNPRITEEEVVHVARDRQADEEMLRTIMNKREWMKLYQVRLGLVKNPRTPLANAIRILGTLIGRDVERIAKSRDVPQGVVAQARRVLFETQRRS
jgi:hypothetical protein